MPKAKQGLGMGMSGLQRDTKERSGVLEMFYILMVMVITTAEYVCQNTRTVQ